MKKILLFTVWMLLINPQIFAQDDEQGGKGKKKKSAENESESAYCKEESSKAIKNYEKGINRKDYKKNERVKFLYDALEEDPDFPEANVAIGKEMIVTFESEGKSTAPAKKHFLKAIEICPQVHSDPYYYLGLMAFDNEDYEEAKNYLKKFLDFKSDDEKKFAKDYDEKLKRAKLRYGRSKFMTDIMSKPKPFDPHVVSGISTKDDEYLAIITPDNTACYFTRRMPVSLKNEVVNNSDREIEVFEISKRGSNGTFDAGVKMPQPFNLRSNEGGPTLTIDNKRLFYTIVTDGANGLPNYDIYYSENINGQWSPIKSMGQLVNDPVAWDSQPTIAADGKTLIFASDRKAPGAMGGVDLYVTTYNDTTKRWNPAVNMGQTINSPGDDKSPFMHSDSETLYFSSNGHAGVGGFDVFYTRKDEKGQWLWPINIGIPINTEDDDLGFFVSSDGKSAYFSSNNQQRLKGVGKYDIFSFELYPEARPQAIAFMKGDLKDDKGKAVTNAKVEIKNVATKEKVDVVTDSASGHYVAVINLKKNRGDFIIRAKKDSAAFSSQIVTIKDTTAVVDKPYTANLEVKKADVGSTYAINNIFYETNKADLLPASLVMIEAFVEYLKENPHLKIEIQGHTDNVGDPAKNIALSNDRAFTLKEKLEELGIEGRRINAKGYGANKPIADNNTPEGRAKNRRTEFMITAK